MLRRWLVSGLAVGLMASALLANPGAVTTKQGDTFKGNVTEDEKFYYIDGPGGQLKIDKRNVDKVQIDQSIDDQYTARHAKLSATDVKGRIELANWANDQKRADLAVTALEEARKIDPTNRDAAIALDAAQRQVDLDKSGANKTAAPAATTQAGTPATPPTPTPTTPKEKPLEHRLLNADEINVIRQKEMQSDDDKLKVRFENHADKKYLTSGDHDATAFNAQTDAQKAAEILANGDKSLAKDVHILNDPAPLATFKLKIQPIFQMGCAAAACHGGTKAGNFQLYTGDSPAATYTNFFILQTYSKTVDGVKYLAMDRGVPDNSLALQYSLPVNIGKPAHPAVPGWKPRFHTANDPAYLFAYDWLSKSLGVLQPDYGIKVAVKLPSTQPAEPAK
jgi:hypothetical protein